MMKLKTTHKAEIDHAIDCFIRRYGTDSEYQAAVRARELDTCGEKDGAALWHAVELELRDYTEAVRNLH
jgi:hypothetical protein